MATITAPTPTPLSLIAQDRTRGRDRHPLEYGATLETGYGNVAVQVQADGRHHSTVRADALRLIREHLGQEWAICAYLGQAHYRTTDGHPRTACRFSAVRIAR
jgi:hypothetical protein